MVDPVQFVLLAVIIILTLLLVILGMQIFFILVQARKAVSKTNVILEKADSITESVKTPLAAISSLSFGVKASSLITVAKFIRNILSHDKNEEEENGKQK